MKKIKLFALLLAAALLIAAFASCSEIPSDGSQTEPSKDRTDQNPEDTEKTIQLAGRILPSIRSSIPNQVSISVFMPRNTSAERSPSLQAGILKWDSIQRQQSPKTR